MARTAFGKYVKDEMTNAEWADYCDEWVGEHPLVALSSGAMVITSVIYTTYRVGRGVVKLIKKFRR